MKKYYLVIEESGFGAYKNANNEVCNLYECTEVINPESQIFECNTLDEAIEYFGLTEIKKEEKNINPEI